MQHLIDGAITAIVQTAINGNIDQITAALPFARSRTPQEKEHLAELGPKRYAVMVILYNIMVAHPTIFPASFNQANFTKSYQLIQVLDAIIARLETLLNLIKDTRVLVGSDIYANAMQAYDFEKSADKRGDAPIHDSLQQVVELMGHVSTAPTLLSIPQGGSATISNMDKSKKFLVIGPNAVSARQESATLLTAIIYTPLTAYDILSHWDVMVVTNLGTTGATSISYHV